MESNFNHEQSLSLINEMITRARNNVRMGSSFSLLYWGYLTATFAIIQCVLLRIPVYADNSFFIWILMAPAGVVSWLIERKNIRKKLIITHIDLIGGLVWLGFLISWAVSMVIFFTAQYIFDMHAIFSLYIPVVLMMVGMGHFITACVFRHKMWYVIAALTWAGAIACAFLHIDMQFIVFAVCMIIGLVIPGHVLHSQAKKSHV
jgi:hypothetical protein